MDILCGFRDNVKDGRPYWWVNVTLNLPFFVAVLKIAADLQTRNMWTTQNKSGVSAAAIWLQRLQYGSSRLYTLLIYAKTVSARCSRCASPTVQGRLAALLLQLFVRGFV